MEDAVSGGPEGQASRVRCPACGELCAADDDFIRHLERHRPVDGPQRGFVACPKGCGRFLGKAELPGHARLCDGQPPLAPIKLVRKHYRERCPCPFCHGMYRRIGIHLALKHRDRLE